MHEVRIIVPVARVFEDVKGLVSSAKRACVSNWLQTTTA